MTAMGDKLKEAGVDTLGAEFYARATDALKSHRSVRDAWRALGEQWGHAVLTKIFADMQGLIKSKLGDHASFDTHTLDVPRGASGGLSRGDTQSETAAARSTSPAPRQPKPFHKQTPKTDEQKQITRQAMLTGSSLWREAKLDKLKWREVPQFVREHISAGANSVLKGRDDIKRAAIAFTVYQHGKPSNPDAVLSECVTEKEGAKIFQMGDRQTSLIIAKLQQMTAVEIEAGIKLIAAE